MGATRAIAHVGHIFTVLLLLRYEWVHCCAGMSMELVQICYQNVDTPFLSPFDENKLKLTGSVIENCTHTITPPTQEWVRLKKRSSLKVIIIAIRFVHIEFFLVRKDYTASPRPCDLEQNRAVQPCVHH